MGGDSFEVEGIQDNEIAQLGIEGLVKARNLIDSSVVLEIGLHFRQG